MHIWFKFVLFPYCLYFKINQIFSQNILLERENYRSWVSPSDNFIKSNILLHGWIFLFQYSRRTHCKSKFRCEPKVISNQGIGAVSDPDHLDIHESTFNNWLCSVVVECFFWLREVLGSNTAPLCNTPHKEIKKRGILNLKRVYTLVYRSLGV